MSTLEKLKQLQETACVVDFLKTEAAGHECTNCGKCVYGYEGVSQIQIIFNDISEKKSRSSDLELLERLCALMQGNCLCEKGDEIAQAVIYALQEYGEEIKNHVSKKSCSAGVCKKFITYHIFSAHPPVARTPCHGTSTCFGHSRPLHVHFYHRAELLAGLCTDGHDVLGQATKVVARVDGIRGSVVINAFLFAYHGLAGL